MEIKNLREEIERLDKKLAESLSKRMKIAEKIGEIKKNKGLPLRNDEREKEILDNVTCIAKEMGANPEIIRTIFEKIISLSRLRQGVSQPKVAFQGEIGAYSEATARIVFGKPMLIPCKEFSEVFDQVEIEEADFGLVPIENSTEGSVSPVYDLLLERNLFITGQFSFRVRHCLMGLTDADIKEVYSHPQALGQCRKFLEKKNLKPVAYYDTAGAVKMIKEKNLRHAGAIASEGSAKYYGMKIFEKDIEDNKNNYTRFVVISKYPAKSLNNEKTSIIFSVSHKPGSLCSAMHEFAKRKISLTKIESRPTKGKPWEYIFYLDFEGNLEDQKCKEALECIRDKATFVKVLGSYSEV